MVRDLVPPGETTGVTCSGTWAYFFCEQGPMVPHPVPHGPSPGAPWSLTWCHHQSHGLVVVSTELGSMDLLQQAYINQLLKQFNLQDVKLATTPLSSGIHLMQDNCPTTDEEKKDMANVPYASLIRAIMYSINRSLNVNA